MQEDAPATEDVSPVVIDDPGPAEEGRGTQDVTVEDSRPSPQASSRSGPERWAGGKEP